MTSLNKSDLLNYFINLMQSKASEYEINGVNGDLLLIVVYENLNSINTEAATTLENIYKQYHFDLKMKAELAQVIKGDKQGSMRYYIAMKNAENKAIKNKLNIIPLEYVIEYLFINPSIHVRSLLNHKDDKEERVEEKKEESKPLTKENNEVIEEELGGNFLADLTINVKKLHKMLTKNIYGQDHAIQSFLAGYFKGQVAMKADKERKRPCATFLFAGPSGVGKTFLAEQAANALKLPFLRLDMSEYSDHQSALKLIGMDKSFKDASRGLLTDFVNNNPKCILLFDEIEKAHLNVIHIFLQILDAGRLREAYDNSEVSFKDTVIIFTTNAGRSIYENDNLKNLSGISRKNILKALNEDINPNTGAPLFPKAICSRFSSGNVVMFNYVDVHYLNQIVKNKLEKNAQDIKNAFNIEVELADEISLSLILSEGGSADARSMSGRSSNFVSEEIYELFRLMTSESATYDFNNLKKIKMEVDIDNSEVDIKKLFRIEESMEVLVVGSRELVSSLHGGNEIFKPYTYSDIDQAKQAINKKAMKAIFLEPYVENRHQYAYLNIEDISEPYIDFYKYLLQYCPFIPIYIIDSERVNLTQEEKDSFTSNGVQGIIDVKNNDLKTMMCWACERIYKQGSVDELARFNKVLHFETAQSINVAHNEAIIKLIRLRVDYAIDGSDMDKFVSSINIPNVTMDQVIGAKDVKDELTIFVEMLKHPLKYANKGLRRPKGILLYGPPGTGKTMLAKAMAHEAKVNFLSCDGGQFLKRFVGEGPELVHKMFKTARKYAPSILFIDEIDAIAINRDSGGDYTRDVLNAFLTEMDGFSENKDQQVFILAATNAKIEADNKAIDPALIRRFDRKIYVALPTYEERIQYLKQRVNNEEALVLDDNAIASIAKRTPGISLAILDAVIALAQRQAVLEKEEIVNEKRLSKALEEYNYGKEHTWSEAQVLKTARHEAGHAYINYLSGEIPSFVTIVSRGNFGGYMQYESHEDKFEYTKKELLNRIKCSMGGRASEIVYYGREEGITSGASGDLENATRVAKIMLCNYGMDENQGLAFINNERELSPQAQDRLYVEINKILSIQLEQAINDIASARDKIDALVEVLMKENQADSDTIKAIFDKE